jgi:glycosyltransferase involved in cell wall biosynthesis
VPDGCKVVVVMPAYNASKTLERTVSDIQPGSVDDIILCDDASSDETVAIARRLRLRVLTHAENRGYGANQKTCYDAALDAGANIVVMVHPDYQYDPRVIPLAVGFIRLGICDVIVASRIRARREAMQGGMPVYKYIANRVLTIIENLVLGQNLGDFHSGFRVYSREVLEALPYHTNSDDFVFDGAPRASGESRVQAGRRSDPGAVHARGVVDQFPAKRHVRPRDASGSGAVRVAPVATRPRPALLGTDALGVRPSNA